MGQALNRPEMAALAYLHERGGSIFINEAPPTTVKGLFGRTIAGLDAYEALCQKGLAQINTRRDHGDARFGDTIECVANRDQVNSQGEIK